MLYPLLFSLQDTHCRKSWMVTNFALSDWSKERYNFSDTVPYTAEVHRKTIANMFWNYELEDELRESGRLSVVFRKNSDREEVMQDIDNARAVTRYEHNECSNHCIQRGEV